MESSVTIYKHAGATSVSVTAYIRDDGDVVVGGYDVGEAPTKTWGSSDYEYLVSVKPKHKDKLMRALAQACGEEKAISEPGADKDKLMLALIETHFGGNSTAVSAFQSFCKDHGIPAEFWSWS